MKNWSLLACLPFLAAVGCTSEFPVARVSGRILVDGAPVEGLKVSFAPIGTPQKPISGPPSIAYTDADGRYTLQTVEREKGAVIGPCRVRINAVERIADDPDFGKTVPKRPPRRIPAKYNDETTLTFDVPKEGTTSADFSISWK